MTAFRAMTGFHSIALLTDYGLEDAFVAVCHGVIAGIAADARIIDITHLVPPQDVRRGAAVLAQAAPHLSPAVFVAVVDPEVGGDRRPVAVAAGESLLVGPDNGLLLPAADMLGPPTEAVVLDRPDLFRPPVSPTFHGRDVFAPVAARLFSGLPLREAGTAVDPASLRRPAAAHRRVTAGGLEAEVVHVDRFGNVQLGADAHDLAAVGLTDGVAVTLSAGSERSAVVGRQFAAVPEGESVVYVDSDERVAVAVNRGRADQVLDVVPGDLVHLAPT